MPKLKLDPTLFVAGGAAAGAYYLYAKSKKKPQSKVSVTEVSSVRVIAKGGAVYLPEGEILASWRAFKQSLKDLYGTVPVCGAVTCKALPITPRLPASQFLTKLRSKVCTWHGLAGNPCGTLELVKVMIVKLDGIVATLSRGASEFLPSDQTGWYWDETQKLIQDLNAHPVVGVGVSAMDLYLPDLKEDVKEFIEKVADAVPSMRIPEWALWGSLALGGVWVYYKVVR